MQPFGSCCFVWVKVAEVTPDFILTRCWSFSYDPLIKQKGMQDFVDDWGKEDVEYLSLIFAYSH